jgi:glycosyltransferase involved in cell wall biosynthesis
LGQLGAGDHVLLGTAHARELLAVFLVCRQLEADRRPTFHLEFRHPLFRSQVTSEELISSPVVKLHRTFLSLYEKWGPLEAIRFYTDTRQLSEDFNLLGTTRFGVLPIPFRSELIAPPCHSSGEPLQLVFLGQARDEKGFPWLPDLVDDLDADYVRTGKVRFSIQANLGAPQYNPRSAGALARLKQCPHKVVELLGLDAPLTPGEYYRLVSRANIVLLPYDRDRYRAASSGTLADAIAGGRPVVVPSRGWMAGQLPHGAGETFDDYESFVSAVRRVIDNYESYAATALRGRSDWLVQHTPDALLSAVTTRSQSVRHAPRAA